jgi:rod shape-determining protein MreD
MFAAFVQGPLIRVIPVGIILLALQRTLFVELTVDGVIIQVMTAFAAAAGAVGGSERGAVVGFVLGMMFDLVEGTPLGSTAIAMTIAGVVAGLLALITPDPQWWLLAIFTGLGAAAAEIAAPVVRVFIGEVEPFDARLAAVVPTVAVSAALMSPLLVPLARWCLRLKPAEWKESTVDAAT